MNGQWPVPRGNDISTFGVDPEYYYVPYATSSIHFPENVDTAALYPEKSFEYTLFDGTVRDVQCFIPGEAKEAARFGCPQPFVNPIDDNHVESCIQPCPVQAYTDEEYSVMWAISNGIGIIGLSLNLFMTCTWMIAGKRIRSKLPYQLKFCVFAGLLFGMLGTLPSLILKYDLPCECDTEECTGTSTVCAINRASIYILLSILINLCALTFKLAHAIVGSKRRLHQGTLNFFCTAIPILLAILGYALEGGSNEGENSKLNTARHAFSCSMRFDDMETEWLLLWCHFLWSGIFSMCFCFVSWRQIGIVSRGASLNKSGKSTDASNSRRRLLRIAVMVTVCLLLNAIATLSTSAKLSEWSRTADISLACHIKETAFSRDWETYGLNEEETTAVCSKEDANEVALGPACATDCFWYPPITIGGLTCEPEGEGASTFEERLEFKASAEAQFTTYDIFNACDCPCVSLIQIERPSVVMLTLAHVAQALVVVIVGVNMGFRKENMLIWKTFLRGRNTKGASSAAVSAFDVENKGYD